LANSDAKVEVYIHILLAKTVINNVVLIHITSVKTTHPVSINDDTNVTKEEQQLESSTYSDHTTRLLSKDNREEHSNNNNYEGEINKLNLPYGLIELLVKNNYTLDSLINTHPSELSGVLAIDQEVAAIICAAANKKNNNGRKTANRGMAGDDTNNGS
jgi:hypothetical protein